MGISILIRTQTEILGLFILLSCFISFINLSSCQSVRPQNIQVFYPWSPLPSPISAPSPAPVFSPLHQPTPNPPGAPPLRHKPSLPPPPTSPPPPPSSSVSNKAVYTAIGVTAASTLVVAGLLFLFYSKYAATRRRGNASEDQDGGGGNGGTMPMLQPQTEFTRFDGQVRGLIVDENGLDVVYWRKLEGSKKQSFLREVYERPNSGKRPFNRIRSSSSNQVHPGGHHPSNLDVDGDSGAAFPPSLPPLPPTSGRASRRGQSSGTWLDSAPVPPLPQPVNLMAIPKEQPQVRAQAPAPPPPAAPMVETNNQTAPALQPPPPAPGENPAPPPPPPPKAQGTLSPKPPCPSRQTSTSNKTVAVASSSGTQDDQVKLKPLHWEKVNVNTDHSMVWDKVEKGSFRYNGDLMEALFGSVAVNRKSPKENNTSNKKAEPSPSAKIFILDARRSQNIAIVLRSLGVTRMELIDCLTEGKGLNSETLEKLVRTTPTKEESSQILGYNSDPTKLADAESFLYYILKAIPSAFTRANAMLFRLNYDYEVFQLRESLKTLESACSELRSRGVFLKLLEAILKAGNRLNAGTSRGDAKAFSLSTLLKLSDYKSSDGKTTLLHFVVHEVVRNEGRRCLLTRNNSSRGRDNRNNMPSRPSDNSAISKEEQEREYIKLGLPMVGGLGAEFLNVKKAATIDHEILANTISSLTARVVEVQQLVAQCGNDIQEEGHFAKEMKSFIQSATEELKAIKDEQIRVMEFVKRTNQYYQSGSSKDKQPLQIFVVVNGFLNMVDQTCIEIARSLQQKKPAGNKGAASASASAGSSTSQQPDVLRTRVTFPRLPAHFLSDKASSSGSDDEG